MTAKASWWYSDEALFAVCCTLNLLNFVDRGIVPGASIEFDAFIIQSTHTKSPDTLLGLLQSAFIVGLLLGALLFGHWIHFRGRFFLTCLGMATWLLAAVLAGFSYYSKSYIFLLFARMLSGFGEASLQCTLPPWIQNHAPAAKKGLWLAVFYTAIPVGTALGYAYSAAISSVFNWSWTFFIEALLVLPLLAYLSRAPDEYPPGSPTTGGSPLGDIHTAEATTAQKTGRLSNDDTNAEEEEEEEQVDKMLLNSHMMSSDAKFASPLPHHHHEESEDTTATKSSSDHHSPSLWEEFVVIMQRPVFLCFILSSAAQTASLIGLSTFGSAFLLGLGFYDREVDASGMFGILISLAGIVATPIGGWCLDRDTKDLAGREDDDFTLHRIITSICTQTYWTSYLGTFLLCMTFFMHSPALYLATITVGCGLIFFTNTGLNMGIMLAVPAKHRSFAIAVGILFGHALGDVPSPIIAGLIKDALAPNCVARSATDANVASSAACRNDEDGLRLTMLAICLWMFWSVFLFFLAWFFQQSQYRPKKTVAHQ